MLDRYWREHSPVIGTGLILAGALGALALTNDQPRDQTDQRPDTARAEYTEPATDSVRPVLPIEEAACADAEAAGDGDPDQREKRNLCAQFRSAIAARETADLARWQMGIGIVGLMAVLATLWANIRAVEKAAESNRLQTQISLAERRAWIRLTPSVSSAVYEGLDPNMRPVDQVNIRIRRENIGQLPAINVGLWIDGSTARFTLADLDRLRQRIDWRRRQVLPVERTLFPSEDFAPHHAVGLGLPAENSGDVISRVVYGWAEYQILAGAETHFTPFIWQVSLHRRGFAPVHWPGQPAPTEWFGIQPHHLSLPPD